MNKPRPFPARRQMLTGALASVGMMGVMRRGSPALAQAPAPAPASAGQENVILSGGAILTMDPRLDDLPQGDLHLRDGEVVAVAPSIDARGARRIDMRGTVVMPGFVDTHWHMWNTIARGMARSEKGGFAKTMAALAEAWTPEASALSVRLALAEAVHAGITTVHNWAHNIKGPEFAAAELAAMRASGIRGRFAYGYPQNAKPGQVMDIDGLSAMRKRDFPTQAPAGLISLGLCVRGPDRSDQKVWRAEWSAAREMNLPLSTHIASTREAAAKGSIPMLARAGLLGPDIQLVHATHATADDFALVAEARSPLSISPWTELEVGYGLPALKLMAEAKLAMGLSVDNMVLAGQADMFGVMRLTADLAAGMAEAQAALPDRQVLEWATLGGAETLGLGDDLGSLSPGKRADVVAVRTDALNTAPAGSLDFMLTHAAQPANVDFVMIDGVIHKQAGRLTRVDLPALLAESRETITALRQRAGV